ncbi:MAG: cysteine desulfurase [Planctomycetales bacterium]|nr:cysteine desulfurase [Planctomycetales bacterium]
MPPPAIYLDNNATTRIDPAIARRMLELQLQGLANPASQHRPGRLALRLLEEAKADLLQSLGAPHTGIHSAQLILTSGGTEANNLAIRGYAAQSSGIIVVAASEHPSVMEAARQLPPERLRILPVDHCGRSDLDLLRQWLQQDAARIQLVSVMLGNNESGALEDLGSITELCQHYGVPVHSDAVQAVSKIDLDMGRLGLSALTFTAHKMHGPVGIGGLILLPGEHISPLLVGGGQQLGIRPGTEAVVPAVALAQAVTLGDQARAEGQYTAVAHLRDRFEHALAAAGPVEVVAAAGRRLPHVSNIAFLGVDRQALHMALDLAGVACSTGSACASGSGRPSPVLTAMGLSAEAVRSSIRFSFSRFTTADEIDTACSIIIQVVNKLRSRPAGLAPSAGS